MKLYILDTDHVSLFQRQHPSVVQRIEEIEPDLLVTTIVTVEEQIRGRFNIIKRASKGPKLIQAYTYLQDTITYFNTIQILPFDQAANAQYEALRKQKIRVGTQDLRIAAIALSVNGTVVTRNWRDFPFLPAWLWKIGLSADFFGLTIRPLRYPTPQRSNCLPITHNALQATKKEIQ